MHSYQRNPDPDLTAEEVTGVDAVEYTAQTRTAAEQLQARTNIGAAASVVSAFYAEMSGSSTLTNDDATRVFPHSGNPLTETYDTLSEFDGTTGKFTATTAGYYRFRIQVTPSAVGVTRWHWGICKNAGVAGGGVVTVFKDMVRQYSPVPNQLTISPGECVVYLAAGDYVQLCYTVSGTVTTTSSASAGSFNANYFWGEKL